MITVAVSPYHLTSREPAAMAPLLFADRVLTMLPAPISGRRGVDVDRGATRAAVDGAPGYLRWMDALSWARELFVEGVIGSTHAGEDIADDVHEAWARLQSEDAYANLRPLMRDRLYDDDRAYLTSLSNDLLRGGPDPAVSIPVAAGIDSFSARHGVVVARAEAASVVQRIESRMWTRAWSVAVPVLLQASAERLLEAREELESELDELRGAMELAWSDPTELPVLREAVDRYTRGFESARTELLGPGVRGEVKAIAGMASVAAVSMPCDAVFRSSLAAARSLASSGASGGPQAGTPAPAGPMAPAAPCASIVIRQIARDPA